MEYNNRDQHDNTQDFLLGSNNKNTNFTKKMLIFLLENDCAYQNIIVYTPIKKTLFSMNYNSSWEDANHAVCFSLSDLIQKVMQILLKLGKKKVKSQQKL